MSAQEGWDEATFDATQGATVDPDVEGDEVASFLVPRLAAYAAPPSSGSSSSRASEDGDMEDDGDAAEARRALESHAMAEEDHRAASGSHGRDSGERSAAHVTDDARASAELAGVAPWAQTTEDLPSRAYDPFLTERDAEEAEVVGYQDDDADALDTDGDADEELAEGGAGALRQARAEHGAASSFVNAFAHNRVKELLKYEGSSSIISKDAAAAACEAVALLTRDLVAMAAGEASRRHRKTVTYDDVARMAQLLDRFSYLADVVPPVPVPTSSLSAGKSIVVGSHVHGSPATAGTGSRKRTNDAAPRSRSAQERSVAGRLRGAGVAQPAATGAAAARSKTAHPRLPGVAGHTVSVHPQPGGGLRQATLRF